jgi:hypothetical protein
MSFKQKYLLGNGVGRFLTHIGAAAAVPVVSLANTPFI